jgi:hypothetical protein
MQKKIKKMLKECLTCFGGGSGRFVQGKRGLEEGRLSLHFAMRYLVDGA